MIAAPSLDTARPLYINGVWQRTAETLTAHNPATGAALAEVCVAGPVEVRAAVAAAEAAFATWRATTERQRQAALGRLHAVIAADSENLIRLLSAEQGKPRAEALVTDVQAALEALRYYARHGARALRPARMTPAQALFRTSHIQLVHEPAGVVAIIAPWNIPFGIPAHQIAAALLVGNTVVLEALGVDAADRPEAGRVCRAGRATAGRAQCPERRRRGGRGADPAAPGPPRNFHR